MATMAGVGDEITNAELPRDIPSDLEDKFLVIICEPDSVHWSIHEGTKHGFAPLVFWT